MCSFNVHVHRAYDIDMVKAKRKASRIKEFRNSASALPNVAVEHGIQWIEIVFNSLLI